jgi:BlaI family penicillinase repressor
MSADPSISETERAVLKVLWDRGPGTVREILAELNEQGFQWAYTTVQTLLNRLVAKSYVLTDRGGAAHVFRAAISRNELLQQKLNNLAETYCEGVSSPLVLALVEGSQLSSDDIAALREMLDRLEDETQKGGKK